MFRSLLLSSLLFSVLQTVNAQSKFLANEGETKKFAEGIVASISTGNMPGATKELRQIITIPAKEFDLFEAQLAAQAGSFLSQIGSPTSYEFIKESRLGKHLIRQQFLVLHEKAALRVNLVFYKTGKGWVVTHFNFDTHALTFFE